MLNLDKIDDIICSFVGHISLVLAPFLLVSTQSLLGRSISLISAQSITLCELTSLD